MTLASGTRLGPFEILAPLGAGGMGEVYRARDTRLGRDVAVKILPQRGPASAEERARFRREAKAISSLNHPHICVLHDIGLEGDTDYLVMELVEGETLARRITKGPLPTSEVLRIGAQIADALDRAHRAGVVHRDLKPGNVMLTKSGAKLMDFGLAREFKAPGRDPEATVTERGAEPEESITKQGMIVGTFQYMAPEQLEGRRADARSDIWALGCVLYEMATGKRAFEGSTPVSVISAIMKDEPRRMSELAPLTPPAFERLVRQCLAKDPDERWQTAGDLRRELIWIGSSSQSANQEAQASSRTRWNQVMSWSLVLGVAVVVAVLLTRSKPSSFVFELSPPTGVATIGLPRISPDGGTVAFNAVDSAGVSSIWVRSLNALSARRLAGTEGAARPFWAPNSHELGFFANGKLFKITTDGGPPLLLSDAPHGSDGSWSKRGVILFDGRGMNDSIQALKATGGEPWAVVTLDRKAGEYASYWPEFLPDGDHFLFLSGRESSQSSMLKVGSVRSNNVRSLGSISSRSEYALGHILYVSGGTLVARPFDSRALSFKGDPKAVAENVVADPDGGYAAFSASQGTILYRTVASPPSERLIWLDRAGHRLGTLGPPGFYESPALSPSGTQLAFDQTDPSRAQGRVWIWDIARNVGWPLSAPGRRALAPVWSPDGKRVAYGMQVPGPFQFDIFIQAAAGSGVDSLLYTSREVKDTACWSSDGKRIVYMVASSTRSGVDICAISLSAEARSTPLVATQASEFHPSLSPNGRLLAYESNLSGRKEIYVQELAADGERVQVSLHGGTQPSWRSDGRELYYLSLDRELMVLTAGAGSMQFSSPKRLFQAPVRLRFDARNQYVPSPDGQRFLFISPEGTPSPGTTVVMTSWADHRP